MAAHGRDNILHGKDHTDAHLDSGRWRHQESSSYARHVSPQPRDADSREAVISLATYLQDSRTEPIKAEPGQAISSPYKPIVPEGHNTLNGHLEGANGLDNSGGQVVSGNGVVGDGPDATDEGEGAQNKTAAGRSNQGPRSAGSGSNDGREVRCGPLLNYRRMEEGSWFGSVLIVVRGGGSGESPFKPTLHLSRAGNRPAEALGAHGEYTNGNGANGASGQARKIEGVKLYSDPRNTFWRFTIDVEMENDEVEWAYNIPGLRFTSQEKTDEQSFFVPAATESMRIMFHSCNGFSVGTDEESWSGAALWNDVMRKHKEHPFHVMLGGGDQIYNDGIRVSGPLRPWTDISNPKKRREYPFPEKLRKECDDYYVSNYIRWYSTEPFAGANGKIPQLNLWDDHDIIDGFGSYVHEFMKCDVFRGIGGCAYKYYMLFQHHLPPPISTYTTDAPQTMSAAGGGPGADPAQSKDTYVLENEKEDSSYIIGLKPGPYVAERSRSIYARLGARIGFFGIDARTERTRHQVNYPETYQVIFDRLKSELSAAASGPTPIQHLIVLLGIPIAYPRLTWLENIFSSPLMGPIKFLNKRFGLGGGFFNHFDGSVDLLDDLDDHYTSRTHKKERHDLIIRLQDLAASYSVRVTILGGDVHLAALGRFYSNPKLRIPVEADHRYMANIISSAIVNKPPPQAVANLLARRNKLHHLDENTDETLMKMFDTDPGEASKTANSNHVTMPSRNWAMITENSERNAGGRQAPRQVNGNTLNGNTLNGNTLNGNSTAPQQQPPATATSHAPTTSTSTPRPITDGHHPLHAGEETAGTKNRAAIAEQHGTTGDGSLDVCIRVERDQHDSQGRTTSYGMWVPLLQCETDAGETMLRKRDAVRGAVAARTGHRAHT